MSLQLASVDEVYQKNKEMRKEDVLSIMDWINLQPHLPKLTELEVMHFLNACGYSVEGSKKVIDLHFTCRTHCPEVFSCREPNEALQQHMNFGVYYYLPGLTPNGSSVCYSKVINNDPAGYHHTEQLKIYMMVLDLYLLRNGPTNSHIMLIDMDGSLMAYLLRVNIAVARKHIFFMEQAVNVKLGGIYHMNSVSWVDKILTFLKPLLSKELLDTFHFYNSNNMEEIYKYVPKKMLPKNYGGESPTYEEMHELMKKDLIANADYFKEEEQTKRVNEALRPSKAKNAGDLFGVEGSFKKLDID